MSKLECLLRPLNSYTRNEDVIYSLLNEVKIDVWKIKGYNAAILRQTAQSRLGERLMFANMMKSYNNALTMDSEDDFVQRQINLSGLDTILQQNRIGAAAAARIPMAKLFGESAQGFSSGADSIENYNASIETSVREPARELLREVLPLRCKQIFGFIPESLEFDFKPLRTLSPVDEENVKTSKFNRADALRASGTFTPQEFCEWLKSEEIMTMETAVLEGADPVPPEASVPIETPQNPATSGKMTEKKGLD